VSRNSDREDTLVDFLRRMPYSSRGFLDRVFGEMVVGRLLHEEGGRLRSYEVKGSGVCYADRKEPACVLLDLCRLEVARNFALEVMGEDAIRAGLSPGFEADGEFLWDNRWWRLWVDLGGCAPEALGFIREPPKEYGGGVRDIILTCDQDRLDSLVNQVELSWGGGRKIHVWLVGTGIQRVARPKRRTSATIEWKPYGRRELEAHIRIRHRGDHRRSVLGRIASKLSMEDWEVLVEAGNNPLLTTYELAYLFSDDGRDMRARIDRIKGVEESGLIETGRSPIARDQLEDRKIITPLAIEMLAGYWGTKPDYMRRFQPWPQKADSKIRGKTKYSLRWLSNLGDHQRLVRQFAMSLLYGARCVSNLIGGAQVEMTTTVGSRLLYRDHISGRTGRTGIVMPDALIKATIWYHGWLDGDTTLVDRPLVENTLLVEIDRATMPITRLGKRLDSYAKLWKSLKSTKPVLVWVIDGSPYRESKLLEMMRDRHIDGWTVLLDRLVLPRGHEWWLVHAPARLSAAKYTVGLGYESIGGMAPWREVWKCTEKSGDRPFLGEQPWRKRELRRSLRKRGDRERIRYKGR